MMIGDAMTPFDPPFDPVLPHFSFSFSKLFNFEFELTVFDVPVFDITHLYRLNVFCHFFKVFENPILRIIAFKTIDMLK
jgi:hypothetical protein